MPRRKHITGQARSPGRPSMIHMKAVHLFLAVCVVSLTMPTQAAEPYRKLPDSEIKAKLAGMETSDPHSSEQYMRDGTARIVTMGRKIIAKWKVKGGKLCI